MTNSSALRNINEVSQINEEIKFYDDYEQQLIRQSAANALQQHSYMLMHSLSHHEHPFRMRSHLFGVMSGVPESLQIWLSYDSNEPEAS